MLLAIALIVIGAVVLTAGELLGVWSKEKGDTITEWFTAARKWTRGLIWIPLLAGIVLLVWHLWVA
jgi:hypothetical protein